MYIQLFILKHVFNLIIFNNSEYILYYYAFNPDKRYKSILERYTNIND